MVRLKPYDNIGMLKAPKFQKYERKNMKRKKYKNNNSNKNKHIE